MGEIRNSFSVQCRNANIAKERLKNTMLKEIKKDMKKLINKLFEWLGYVPKEEYDHIQHIFSLLLKEMNKADCLYEAIGQCDSIINYKVYGNNIWGYGVMVNCGDISKLVKFYPSDYGAEYAKLCAEELCEMLNQKI